MKKKTDLCAVGTAIDAKAWQIQGNETQHPQGPKNLHIPEDVGREQQRDVRLKLPQPRFVYITQQAILAFRFGIFPLEKCDGLGKVPNAQVPVAQQPF